MIKIKGLEGCPSKPFLLALGNKPIIIMEKPFVSFFTLVRISIIFISVVCLNGCSQKKNEDSKIDSSTNAKRHSKIIARPDTIQELYLEDILACVNFEGLTKKYGAENVKKDVIVETGEGQFKITKLYPDTEKEVEVYWKDGKEYQQIQDVMIRVRYTKDEKTDFSSPWSSKNGIHLGMKLAEIVQLNGKTFTITGFGWDLGGSVVSWEGGKLSGKNINVRFNDFSDDNGGLTPQEFSAISGEMEFDVLHSSITKLNPSVDQISVFIKPAITKDQGQKMVKEVEAKQMKK